MKDNNQSTPPNLSNHIRQGQKLKPLTVSVKTARQLLDHRQFENLGVDIGGQAPNCKRGKEKARNL